MARYKPYSYAQGKFIPIHFAKQILPGTFENSLNRLIDHELDLFLFDTRFRNDENGATADGPRILLKISIPTPAAQMKHKIDSAAGRALYSLRVVIAAPPFAHICRVMGLDRFTLRGKKKVNVQWKLFCIVNNLKKVARYGPQLA